MKNLRVGIFADISNLYFCCRENLKGKINYSTLLQFASRKNNLIRAIAYGIETTDASGFKKSLKEIGWETKFRIPKAFADGSKKADQDVNIAMDIVRMIDLVDKVVLCSADGDFASVLQWCNERGRVTTVIGCGISHELKDVANEWIEIDNSFLEGERDGASNPTDKLVVRSDGICHVHRNQSQ